MEPTTRYVRTEDGASIAYGVVGDGPPLVCPSNVWGDLQAYRRNPLWKPVVDGLAHQGFRVIIYDQRGMGSSDRSTGRYDLESRLLDLEAIVSATVPEPEFAIHAIASSVPTAIAYAAANPARVAKMVLVSGFVRGRDWYDSVPSMKLSKNLSDMASSDWETYTLAMANAVLQYSDSGVAAQTAAAYRSSATPAEYVAWMEATSSIDVSDCLSQIGAPTLLISLTGVIIGSLAGMREMAAAIPEAQMIEVPPGPLWSQVAGRFLRGDERPAPEEPARSVFRTVLFTDLVGHTEMMSRLGDERGRDVLREHERITREVLKQHGGTEIKTMGDGFLASFGSVTRAVECAIALQGAIADRNGGAGRGGSRTAATTDDRAQTPVEPLHIRVGINAGEPIEEDGDLFGATVILASRIAAKAEGGEILVADTVRGLCSGKGFLFADRGEFVAKGFEDPVRIYEVSWR
jgi:class 3 adenylate cyclase/pimeloyl-ACP methyl ester carboxylesterase